MECRNGQRIGSPHRLGRERREPRAVPDERSRRPRVEGCPLHSPRPRVVGLWLVTLARGLPR